MTTTDKDRRDPRPRPAGAAHARSDEQPRSLPPEVREVFAGHHGERGSPRKPTQAGFLALALKGAEAWNAWRAAFPSVEADFFGVNFIALGDSGPWSFRDFDFGSVDFFGARFDYVNFQGARFGSAVFTRALFCGLADFQNVQGAADFRMVRFQQMAVFIDARFGAADFSGARFRSEAHFSGARFDGRVVFNGATFRESASFHAKSRITHDADHEEKAGTAGLLHVSFKGTRFLNDVTFEERQFLGPTSFGPIDEAVVVEDPRWDPDRLPDTPLGWPSRSSATRTLTIPKGRTTVFKGIPAFHGCSLHQDTSFEKAVFEAKPSEDAARAYRTLKLAMSKEQATREEQLFFRLEMETERKLEQGPKKWLFTLYKVLSDYGFGLKEPICRVWLLVGFICAVLFHLPMTIWHVVASGEPIAHIGERLRPWLEYSVINFAPLPGLDRVQEPLRKLLFGDGGFHLAAIFIEILHKTSALLALFLVALALRNLFKMKG